MGSPNHDEYQCFNCMRVFRSPVFDIAREWNRTHFEEDPPSVEIRGSVGLECYCSRECLNVRRPVVMAAENVPIRRPGIGSVESCAKCHGTVDMSCFHVAYLESCAEVEDGFILRTVDLDYLAVLCRRCQPYVSTAAVAETEGSSEASPADQNGPIE